MAEVKNSFLRSKMNKDLDDRLMPEGEYRDALNVSINKSQGDGSSEGNVGTVQTVLGNELLLNTPVGVADAEFIGILPSDNKNSIYGFITNNTLTQDEAFYVPEGAAGLTYLYPSNQNSSVAAGTLVQEGENYTAGTTYNTSGGSGSGMTIRVDTVTASPDFAVATFTIINQGIGYNVNDFVTILGGTENAYINLTSVVGPITLTSGGSGYPDPVAGTTTAVTGSGSGLRVSCVISGGVVTFINILAFGGGYQVGDTISIDGGTTDATFTIDNLMNSYSAIISYNLADQTSFKVIAEGAFLNFSTQNQIYGINLIEDLLFFTDNRNQPRKVNINRPTGYYTTEDQLSVAKYYPCDAITLYQPSEAQAQSSLAKSTATSTVTTNNTTLTVTSASANPPTNLGVLGSLATLTANTGTSYPPLSAPSPCSGGTGRGTTVTYTQVGGVVQTVTVVNLGSGYTNGDILTITAGENNAEFVLNFITQDTFVVDSSGWPTSVVVNNPQTIPAGMDLKFVTPETTMQDASDLYLPASAQAVVKTTASGPPYEITIDPQDYDGFYSAGTTTNDPMFGYHLYLEYDPINQENVFTDSGAKLVSTDQSTSSPFDISVLLDQTPATVGGIAPAAGMNLRLALPNPYYDVSFAETANIEYLTDKFTRFSYRFKYDDGEYSLMAPFTQPCFIPKQDGYFMDREKLRGTVSSVFDDGENEVSDENNAYRSTEVSFMENKVNKITLNIPLPCAANDLTSKFKIEEVDILYKESDQTTIKVVESIPVQGSISGNSNIYQYEYGSKPPFKTLPQAETVRVYDKVPVRALSQEVASNRVIYGNFQNRHTPPAFLDYTLGAFPKQTFNISENIVNSDTSEIEYPNATLKQNRTYEVGIVLSDKFGRQSTVLFSKQSEYSALGEFLASSIYSPYRGEFENFPPEGITAFDGNALNLQFNSTINSLRDTSTGSPGLYNGDVNSQDYNPLGWYSFKVVVKQTEQDYYNVYVPTAMAAYPLDPFKEVTSTSHIVLYNDNINKIPRDLTEVGPTQKDFPSSVRMFGRVGPFDTQKINPVPAGSTIALSEVNAQFYPSKIADVTTNIATVKDLFDYENFPLIQNTGGIEKYVFYNFEYLKLSASGSTFPDSSSLVARINTQNKFGVQVPRGGNYATAQVEIDSSGLTTFAGLKNILPNQNAIKLGQRVVGQGIVGDVFVVIYVPNALDPTKGNVTLSSGVERTADSTWQFFGGSEPYSGTPALNVYEVAPNISLIDIYYETTTSGLIENLNKAIDTGPPPNVFAQLDGFFANANFKEDAIVTEPDYETIITSPFAPVTQSGTAFPSPALNIVTLESITDQSGNDSYNGVPYFAPTEAEPNGSSDGIFGIRPENISGTPNGNFLIVLKKRTSPGAFADIDGNPTTGDTTFDVSGLASATSWPTGTRTSGNPDTAGFRVNLYNPTADQLIGASVSGSASIPEGTVVTNFAGGGGGSGEGTVTISQALTDDIADNFPIVFGKESPGLVYSELHTDDNNLPGNTFNFIFNCSNGGIDPVTGEYFNDEEQEVPGSLTLLPVNPKRPEVNIISKQSSFNSKFDAFGPVSNDIEQVGIEIRYTQFPQPREINPDFVLNNRDVPPSTDPNPILATLKCINGSSTFDLMKEGLTLFIRRMFWAANYTDGPDQWQWLEIGLPTWFGSQNAQNTLPPPSGFPITGILGEDIPNGVNDDYNFFNNHWYLEQIPDSSNTDFKTPIYNLRAGPLGGLDNQFYENKAYCIEIAARDADNNSPAASPSTFVSFVLRRAATGSFSGNPPGAIPLCGVNTKALNRTTNDPGMSGYNNQLTGSNNSLNGQWDFPGAAPLKWQGNGPVRVKALITVVRTDGGVDPITSGFTITLNNGLTATDANGITRTLIATQPEGNIALGGFYPAPADQIELEFQQHYSEITFSGAFGLQSTGTLPQDAVVALRLTIQVCAL